MIRLFGSRNSGKTYQLCQWASHDPKATIVCGNPNAMKYKIKQYGFRDIPCICYEMLYNEARTDQVNYYIDEIDGFLQTVFSNKIIGYTGSIE